VPGQPAASAVTATSATLTWAASTDNLRVTAYDVLRATGSGPAAVVATVSGTTYRAGGLTGDTTYTFSVRARDAAGNSSAASPGRTVTTLPGGGNNGCTATYRVTNSWPGGFLGEVTVTNTGTAAISRWTVTWTNQPGTSITSLWNGTLAVDGSNVTVTNASGNGTVAAGAGTAFGFQGSGGGTAPDGVGCAAS
jgi:cellulase/cellobiase CelA1